MTATVESGTDPTSGGGEPGRAAHRRHRRATRRFWVALVLIGLAGLGLRAWIVLEVRPTCPTPDAYRGVVPDEPVVAPGVVPDDGLDAPAVLEEEGPEGCFRVWGDALYGYAQGGLMAEGHLFVNPAAFLASVTDPAFPTYPEPYYEPSAGKPPLYPLFLGVLSTLGLQTATEQRLVLSLVGATGIVLLGLVGLRLGGRRAGLLAAGIGAAYPVLWVNDGMLMAESIAVPLTALTILMAYRLWDRPDWWVAALLGGVIALLTLTRAETALLSVFLVLPLVLLGLRRLPLRRRLELIGICAAAAVLVIGPWVGWNLTRFREPVLLTSSTGSVLSSASCDATYYGEALGYWANCFTGPWPDATRLDESERDLIPREAALRYVGDHLGRLPVVVAARIGRLWNLYAPLQTVRWDGELEGRGVLATRLGLVSYYAMLPAAVYGLVVLRRRRLPLSPLLAMAAVVTLAAVTTFGILRYRVPADVAMVVAAAVGVDALLRRWWAVGDGPPDAPADAPAEEVPT